MMQRGSTRAALAGRVIWVTGASSGIGAATARCLAGLGASVVLSARSQPALDRVARSLPYTEKHFAVAADVCCAVALQAAMTAMQDRFGRLDGLVANAGVGAFGPLRDVADHALTELVDTNLTGQVRCVQVAIPALVRSRGRIVLVASQAGLRGVAGLGVYSATKAALFALADALRLELRADGVRTTVVVPGPTRTGFRQHSHGVVPELPDDADPAERVAEAIARALRHAPPMLAVRRAAAWKAAFNRIAPGLYDLWLRRRTTPADERVAPGDD